MSRYLTPTTAAEDARHRGEVREQTVDWREEMRCDVERHPVDSAAVDRGRRLTRIASAAADPNHPLHERALVDLEDARRAVPFEVALAETIARRIQ